MKWLPKMICQLQHLESGNKPVQFFFYGLELKKKQDMRYEIE